MQTPQVKEPFYLLNIPLFARDLTPEGYIFGKTRSDLKKIGSAGAGKNRTCWDLRLTLGIPFSRWGAHPFVVRPLPFSTRILEDRSPEAEEKSQAREPRMHPFLLAQSWRQQMEHDAKINKAKIAAWEGILRARVTQVMNLLRLPAEIQADLLRPPAPLEIHSFSERSLRVLVCCEDEETQRCRWQGLIQELKDPGGK